MRYAVTPDQMRQMEAVCIQSGTDSLVLMERAAGALVRALEAMLGTLPGKRVVCYCGQGNNGADGIAAARHLLEAGAVPSLRLLGEPRTDEGRTQAARISGLGIPVLAKAPVKADAALDCLFGIGLNRPPDGQAAAMMAEINALDVPVLSADIPSGMDARTGRVFPHCVRANRTLCFQSLKTGHLLAQNPDVMGQLEVADIGIPMDGAMPIGAADAGDMKSLLPPRRRNAHKGSHGRVLLYCGKMGSAGAAALAAQGCLRAGAGLVTIACEQDIMPILQVLVPNAQCVPVEQAAVEPPRHDVLLAGCGLAETDRSWQFLKALYQPEVPAVLDASALGMLAQRTMKLGPKTLITPHIAEAARLLQVEATQVSEDMPASARALREKLGCTVLLKSHISVIDGDSQTLINTAGSPVLAKGGSGDALAGIAAGLMAQGLDAPAAGQAASLWLGCAAELTEQRHGPYTPLTGDILQLMGELTR